MNEYPPTIVETRDEEEAAPGTTLAGRPYRDPATVPAAEVRRSTTILDPGFRALQIVWFLAGVVETIIGIRVLLKALAANPVAGFVRFMYDVSAPLVAPFRGIVRDVTMGNGGLLEVWSVIAMVVYLLAAYLVARFVRIVTTPRPATAR